MAPLAVGFGVAFAGMEGLFFSRSPICQST
jgi:hypothetical protein